MPCLLGLFTPTAMEYLDLVFSIDLHKFKYCLLIIVLLHPVSNKIKIFSVVSWLPLKVPRVVVVTL